VSAENLQEIQDIVEQVTARGEQDLTCQWIGVRGPDSDPRYEPDGNPESTEGGAR
jgi:hypothetical protein